MKGKDNLQAQGLIGLSNYHTHETIQNAYSDPTRNAV
jgi:hypothetical protein